MKLIITSTSNGHNGVAATAKVGAAAGQAAAAASTGLLLYYIVNIAFDCIQFQIHQCDVSARLKHILVLNKNVLSDLGKDRFQDNEVH